ncbi:hypothetical protein HK101_001200 [Irineochytrium annulatum]|nr:hypothetical protein HK101_001200 [Irineochytrium annulatum]
MRAGVDLALAPLLGMVSAGFAIADSKLTKTLDAQAKINFVKSLVTKIVTAFVMEFKAVFLFDDAQWFDSHTLDVLMALARYCPKIFIQMSKLSKLTVHVTDVDSTITAATYAKTGGSPLFLQMIIDVLFVKVGGDFIVNGDGILTVRDESVRAEAILTDLSAAILFQFDRLDATFQRILKVACVLGQYFNLRNVLDLGDFDMDVAECVELIKDSDIYSFLVCDQPTSSNLPQETADNVEDGAECSFRHISIMNTIYESLAFEERLAANSCVGNMIENIINDDNRDSLLPSLEYHFSRSADVERIVGYKEELGLSLMGKFQTIEGVRILESLVEYVKQASPEDLDMLAEPVTALRKAKWFERLCSGYSLNRSFPKERDAGIAALNYLGAAPWPSGDNEIKIALKKTERRLYINWILTFGGRMRSQPPKRTSPHSTQSKSMAMAQRIELEKAILFSMAEALGYDKAFTGEERLYLVMRHCNLMIRTNNNSIDWTAVLHKVSQYDVYFEHLSLTYAAVIAFQEGRFKTIDEIVESYYRTSATVKDDPIICYQLLYVLYRVALVRGDADAIAEWQAAYEPRSAAARLFNYGIDASECIQTMLAAQIGNFDVALNHLQEYLAVFTKLELSGDMADTALFVPLLVILFFDPVRSGLPVAGVTSIKNCIPTPWGQEDLTRLRIIIGTMKAVMKAFGITHHHVMSFWFHELYVIVELLLEGRKNEAMSMAKRKLRCRRKAELEGLPTQKAMYHGLIAKYATSSSDAAKSREIAANIFKEQNSQLYLKWLNS